MAGEDIQITVGVSGNKDIKILNDNVNKVEASVKRLSAGVDSGRISMGAYEKALEQQTAKLKKLKFGQDEANKAVEIWSKNTLESIAADKASAAAKQEAIAASKAEKEARKAASDAAKIEKAIKQEAALAAKQEALSVKTLAAAERDLQVARKQIIASAQQQAAIEDQLRTKYQSGYAELQLYKRENEQLNLAYQKNIITADQLRAEQDKLSASFAKGTGIFSNYAQQAGRRMNQFGVVTQQAGYQIGDFLVQVQSGTNVFVAFGQQATQLVGTFAMLSQSLKWVGIFSALGIAIPIITAIGAAWMRMSESNDKATESLKAYTKAQEDANSAIKVTQDNIDKLRYGVDESYQVELLKEQVRLRDEIALNIGKGQKYLATTTDSLDRQKMVVSEINARTNELAARHNEISNLLGKQQDRSVQLAISQGIAAQRAGEARAALEQSAEAAENLSKVDITSGIAAASNSAMQLAKNLGISFDVAKKLAAGGYSTTPTVLDPRDPKYDPTKAAQTTNFGFTYGTSWKPNATTTTTKIASGGGGGQTQEDYLQQLLKEDEQKRKLIGLSEAEQSAAETEFNLREKLRDLKGSVTEEEIQSTLRQIEATNKLIEQEARREEMIKSASSTIENAFMSMVDGSKSVSDAFKGMLREILLSVYQQQVVKPLADGLGSFLGGFLGQANGGAWNKGVQMYANGGVVGSPTMFKHSGGLGLMGEAGPEAIMPLKRGSNGKLGVQVDGSQGGVVVHQTFNFSANGDDSVKKIIAQAAPQIAQMTQKQIMDSRRRGGSMKATFG